MRVKSRQLHYRPHVCSVSRRSLVRGCCEEIKHGNSVVKLYASLLARALLDADPKLRSEFEPGIEALK
jgi:hypothetical protein